MKARVYGLLLLGGWALLWCLASCVWGSAPAATPEGEKTASAVKMPLEEPFPSEEVTQPREPDDSGLVADSEEEPSVPYKEIEGPPDISPDSPPETSSDTLPDVETDGDGSSSAPHETQAPCESTVPTVSDDSRTPDDPSQGEWDSQK